MTATSPPPLPADLTEGLKRLKMAAMRELAPELLVTAKTQRWKPEEFLRTLVEAEITARDASNARTRLRLGCFPVTKTLEEFDVAASSIPAATFDYLSSLEWVRAAENVCMIGPAGTGKSHILVALGIAAVQAGHRVRYFTAADLVETLYRALADNSVGKVIDPLLRNDVVLLDELGFAPLDDTGTQLLFRFVAAAYERRSLGIGSHWPFESWGRFLPEHTTAVSMLDRLLHHCHTVITDGDSYRMRQPEPAPPSRNPSSQRQGKVDADDQDDHHHHRGLAPPSPAATRPTRQPDQTANSPPRSGSAPSPCVRPAPNDAPPSAKGSRHVGCPPSPPHPTRWTGSAKPTPTYPPHNAPSPSRCTAPANTTTPGPRSPTASGPPDKQRNNASERTP
jgi:DNA replication protein DnaC